MSPSDVVWQLWQVVTTTWLSAINPSEIVGVPCWLRRHLSGGAHQDVPSTIYQVHLAVLPSAIWLSQCPVAGSWRFSVAARKPVFFPPIAGNATTTRAIGLTGGGDGIDGVGIATGQTLGDDGWKLWVGEAAAWMVRGWLRSPAGVKEQEPAGCGAEQRRAGRPAPLCLSPSATAGASLRRSVRGCRCLSEHEVQVGRRHVRRGLPCP